MENFHFLFFIIKFTELGRIRSVYNIFGVRLKENLEVKFMESLENQIKGLTALNEDNADKLEANMLEESRASEKITTLSLLDSYTEVEKEKVALAEEMKKFLLDNAEFAKKMNEFNKKKQELEEKQAQLKGDMISTMQDNAQKKESNGIFDVTFVAATIKSTFDKDSFKKENEDLYNKYIKKSVVSAYVKISEHK